jgi:hypothetical protein
MMFEHIPMACMGTNEISTAMGMVTMGMRALGPCLAPRPRFQHRGC